MMSFDFDPSRLAVPAGHHIGGRFVELGETEIPVLRPSDHQPLGWIHDGGALAVDRAVEAARSALAASRWARVPPRERGRVLRRWAELIESRRGIRANRGGRLDTSDRRDGGPRCHAHGRGDPLLRRVLRQAGRRHHRDRGRGAEPGQAGALWDRRRDRALELPDDHRRLEIRPCSCRRQRDGDENLGADTLQLVGDGRDRRGSRPASGAAQYRQWPRTHHGHGDHPPSRLRNSFTGSSATGGRIMAAAAEAGSSR